MYITLRNVTKDNYEAICDLDVATEQEEYVACNMFSLVEAAYNDGYHTKAIYLDDKAVGFLMWVQESLCKVSIWRFMVDQNHQQQGIGRKALLLALDEIKEIPKLTEIEICYHPENPVAKDFYSTFGFIEVGLDEDDEDMLAVINI